MEQGKFTGKALVLFDLDGTLVDSVPDIAHSVDHMMVQLGYLPCGENAVRQYIGNGAARLIERALTGEMENKPDPAEYERASKLFFSHYADNVCRHSRLYPGAVSLLQSLHARGITLACITNKPEQFTLPLLRALAIEHFFALVLSGDSLQKKKPDPLPLLHATSKLGFSLQQSLMVGDSSNDIAAAQSAGMQCVGVSYGYNHGASIASASPDAVIDRLEELPALLQ